MIFWLMKVYSLLYELLPDFSLYPDPVLPRELLMSLDTLDLISKDSKEERKRQKAKKVEKF